MRSASPVVGTATTTGRRLLSVVRAATVIARAGSGTASTALVVPRTPARAGSSRRRGGSDRRLTLLPGPGRASAPRPVGRGGSLRPEATGGSGRPGAGVL